MGSMTEKMLKNTRRIQPAEMTVIEEKNLPALGDVPVLTLRKNMPNADSRIAGLRQIYSTMQPTPENSHFRPKAVKLKRNLMVSD